MDDRRPASRSRDHLAKLVRSAKDLAEARNVHALILGSSYKRDKYLANLLVRMYGKCGSVNDAREVFDAIENANVVAFNAMLTTYAQNGHLEDARLFFDSIPQRNFISWNSLISALAQNSCLEEAWKIFDKMPIKDVASWNIMITAAAKDGDLQQAKEMFDQLQNPNQVSWNTMISSYAKNDCLVEARDLFERMPSAQRNSVTWTLIVTAYARCGKIDEAAGLFDRLRKDRFASPPPELWNLMITAYSRSSRLENAKKLFEEMPQPDIVSWRALVAAYAEKGDLAQAERLLADMPFDKDPVGWTAIIAGHGRVGNLKAATALFARLPDKDVVSWNAMVTAAAECGDMAAATRYFQSTPDKNLQSWNAMLSAFVRHDRIDRAAQIFEQMPQRDLVSWTLMLTASSQRSHHRDAFLLFQRMDLEGANPDRVAVACVLGACAGFSSHREGSEIHCSIAGSELEADPLVANALITTYGGFGLVSRAKLVFDGLKNRDLVSWNAMIAALAQNGRLLDADRLLATMRCEGLRPDGISFVALLAACVYAGNLSQAQLYFMSIAEEVAAAPWAEHFKCVVDAMGRCGGLEEAEELVAAMPFEPDVEEWTSILNARRIAGDTSKKAAAQNLCRLDPETPLSYLLFS